MKKEKFDYIFHYFDNLAHNRDKNEFLLELIILILCMVSATQKMLVSNLSKKNENEKRKLNIDLMIEATQYRDKFDKPIKKVWKQRFDKKQK
jgi:hypothetical protein